MKPAFFTLALAVALAAGLGASDAAQRGGGGFGGSAGYSCGSGICTCIGDIDCNDMFGGGSCPGDSRDNCQIGADGVARCTCYTTALIGKRNWSRTIKILNGAKKLSPQ